MAAPDPAIETVQEKKDRWDKAQVILGPVSALITALAISALGLMVQSSLNSNQDKSSKANLYSQLMSSREESESSLRKDMFNSILTNILNGKSNSSLDEKILQLELLTYNFHESLDLMPLFEYLNRLNLEQTKDLQLRKDYQERLFKLGKVISSKQESTLEGVSQQNVFLYVDSSFMRKKNGSVYTDTLTATTQDNVEYWLIQDSTLAPNGKYEKFQQRIEITVLGYDVIQSSADINLRITTTYDDTTVAQKPEEDYRFTLNYFEFPMIDNTRLVENDMRIAVVLNCFDCQAANQPKQRPMYIEMTALYFPGSRAGIKDEPYFDDILAKLLSKQ